ncbi:DNA adenine methylase, partial [Mycoplasmopsis gallinarum]|uniref:DNA adenine methylase n=1 Tax=Mycoplasmopsis gallinarum TaxID=29557 RepID=UPI000B083FE0
MKSLIKSPLNYTGNKYRILEQMQPHFPREIDCMVDLFCGGATVGLNVNARKVIFVDKDERIINLLIFLSKQIFEQFLLKCEEIIDKYSLSYSYKNGYKFYRNMCKDENTNNGLNKLGH